MVYPVNELGQTPRDEAETLIKLCIKELLHRDNYIINENGIFGYNYNIVTPQYIGIEFEIQLEKVQGPALIYGYKVHRKDIDIPDLIEKYDGIITNSYVEYDGFYCFGIKGKIDWWIYIDRRIVCIY